MSRRQRERARSGTAAPPSSERAVRGEAKAPEGFVFTRWTALFGGAGVATVLGGFALLAGGSLTLAPVLLVVGFVVLIPIALVR